MLATQPRSPGCRVAGPGVISLGKASRPKLDEAEPQRNLHRALESGAADLELLGGRWIAVAAADHLAQRINVRRARTSP